MDSTPRWIPLFFGGVMIFMAALILGAVFGVVPTDGGQFLAPQIVIVSIGLCLLCAGLAMWVPPRAPALFRSGLMIISLVSLAAVCNWTAFAPEVVYSSSTSFGAYQFSGEDQIGGRIVFAVAAILVDVFILSAIAGWARSRIRKKD
jgi:hypothetical protein